jgi:hypothetical protein
VPLTMIKSDPRARLKPCLRCGYSLRNVPDARLCPECGLPIWLTLGGNDDLEMSNPQWLRRLTVASLLLGAAHAILTLGILALHGWVLATDEDRYMTRDPSSIAPFVGGPYLALCGVGLMLLGGAEGRIPERAPRLRRATLIAGAIAIAAGAWFVVPYYRFRTPMVLILLVAFAQTVFGWAYMQQLARRIPSQRIGFFAQYLWIGVVILFASLVLRGTGWALWMLYEPWSKSVLVWTLILLAYPPAVTALWLSLARTFHKAADGARKNWEQENSGDATSVA